MRIRYVKARVRRKKPAVAAAIHIVYKPMCLDKEAILTRGRELEELARNV